MHRDHPWQRCCPIVSTTISAAAAAKLLPLMQRPLQLLRYELPPAPCACALLLLAPLALLYHAAAATERDVLPP